jgi:hypothetical protein
VPEPKFDELFLTHRLLAGSGFVSVVSIFGIGVMQSVPEFRHQCIPVGTSVPFAGRDK